MSKWIQILGVSKKAVNARFEGVSEMKVLGGMALMLLLLISSAIVSVNATNEGSWQYGWQQGSLKSPQIASGANLYPGHDNNTCVLGGAVTNATSCENGFFVGYKDWCINHAVNRVGNMTLGYLSDVSRCVLHCPTNG